MNSLNEHNKYTYEYFQQEDVCRLCWNKHAQREIISINTEKDNKNEMLDKIRYCLDIDITDIKYPNKACKNCLDQLEKFYKFKIVCIENNTKLLEIVSRNIDGCTILNGNCILPSENSCVVKTENDDQISEFDNTENSQDIFHYSNVISELKTIQKHTKERKQRITTKYKAKRTPTYCNICRLDFENVEIFSNHNSQCHGIEDGGLYKCFGCEKRFKNRNRRLAHEINSCKGLKDGYQCSVCQRFLPTRRMYENHMRFHRKNIPEELPCDIFKCLKCFKAFDTKSNLRIHMAVHDPEKKNFVCESCGRVFTRQDYLHKHILTHTGVKQHVCPHCSFRTTQKSSLTVHIRKHTGERPYSCDVCPQRCVSSSNLRAHRRRHLGLKKYECTVCSKKFGYKTSLDEHIASVHERSQSHPCQHCGAVYTRHRGLRRHLLAKHGKVKDDRGDTKMQILKNVDVSSDLCLKVSKDLNSNGDKVEIILNDAVKDIDQPDFAPKTHDAYDVYV